MSRLGSVYPLRNLYTSIHDIPACTEYVCHVLISSHSASLLAAKQLEALRWLVPWTTGFRPTSSQFHCVEIRENAFRPGLAMVACIFSTYSPMHPSILLPFHSFHSCSLLVSFSRTPCLTGYLSLPTYNPAGPVSFPAYSSSTKHNHLQSLNSIFPYTTTSNQSNHVQVPNLRDPAPTPSPLPPAHPLPSQVIPHCELSHNYLTTQRISYLG